jgi:hypothetical protein
LPVLNPVIIPRLQTKESVQRGGAENPYYLQDAARHHSEVAQPFGAHNGVVMNEDLKRSLAKMEQLLQIEHKVQAARRRRDAHLRVREASNRAANMKQVQVSRAALQRKNAEDTDREAKAYALERGSAEQILLRKVIHT